MNFTSDHANKPCTCTNVVACTPCISRARLGGLSYDDAVNHVRYRRTAVASTKKAAKAGLHWLATIGLAVRMWAHAWARDNLPRVTEEWLTFYRANPNEVDSIQAVRLSQVRDMALAAPWRDDSRLRDAYQAARKAELKRRAP